MGWPGCHSDVTASKGRGVANFTKQRLAASDKLNINEKTPTNPSPASACDPLGISIPGEVQTAEHIHPAVIGAQETRGDNGSASLLWLE